MSIKVGTINVQGIRHVIKPTKLPWQHSPLQALCAMNQISLTSSLGVKMFNCSIYLPVEQQNTAKHGTPGQKKNINLENPGANLVG